MPKSQLLSAAALVFATMVVTPLAAQNPFVTLADVDEDATCKSLPTIYQVSSGRDGVLRDTLTMAPGKVQIDNTVITRNIYNGRYNAPLYRLNPGDRIDILVRNRMDSVFGAPLSAVQVTNQHYHGYIVTPKPDSGDNVVPVTIQRGSDNRNSFPVPLIQSEGLMWYHPHPHGNTATQVNGGLAGAMIVGDLLHLFPDFRDAGGANERVMYIKDTRDDKKVTTLNILGNTCTRLTIRPGQRQLWRIANMSANSFVNLKLAGKKFTVLAWDGNRVKHPMDADSLFVSPGSRVEAVVSGWQRAGAAADSAEFYSDVYQASATGTSKRISLGRLVNSGTSAGPLLRARIIGDDKELADSISRLVHDTNVNHDTIHFELNGNKLQLNGHSYDHDTLNTAVAFGQTQEWVLINDTNFLHTFHIHQTDFIVTQIDGKPQPDSVHLDNVLVGIHQVNGNWVGDTITVRFKYLPIAAGPFVYHCHVLGHEDNGMMANMCVFDPATGIRYCQPWFQKGPWPVTSSSGIPPAAHQHGDSPGGVERRE